MPNITATIEYLADLPKYKTEKPYSALLSNGQEFFAKGARLDNIEFTYPECTIKDVRGDVEFTIDKCGFQIHSQTSQNLSDFKTMEQIDVYRKEQADFLRTELGAVFVNTYDVRPRLNVEPKRTTVNVIDPLLVDQPAKGAHNDVTLKSGPEIVHKVFSEEEKELYLKPGYRVRIMNTWRPLLPVCEDRPLAFCDARTIAPKDLITADRVLPHAVGEIYYLGYNPQHQWCWVEDQTPSDLLLMTMYDTKPGDHARVCPHISFENSRAPKDAAPRRSVETRSIIVTKA